MSIELFYNGSIHSGQSGFFYWNISVKLYILSLLLVVRIGRISGESLSTEREIKSYTLNETV